MILREATIKYAGYDPDNLKPHSNKRICVVCDNCDNVRWVPKNNYSNLCKICSINPLKPKFILKEKDRFIIGTGIDRIETIKLFNYDPIDLSKGSAKKVWSICEKCGNGRLVRFYPYHNICKKCINKGRILSEEHKANISKNSARLSGKDNPMFGRTGDKNPFYGKKHGAETRKLISNNHADVSGENNPMFGMCGKDAPAYGKLGELAPNWQGGLSIREHVKHERNCLKLNNRFEGSEGHHIMSGVIIYIPNNIHSMWHDLKNNKKMNIINELAFNFLMGNY